MSIEALEVKHAAERFIRDLLQCSTASKALSEAALRLRLCAQDHSQLEGVRAKTRQAYDIMVGLARVVDKEVGIKDPRESGSAQQPINRAGIIRVGSLNPHRNGLLNLQGSEVVWSRMKDLQAGLFRTVRDLNLAFLGLHACRIFEDFALPPVLGFDLTTIGGASYASVSILRPLEVCVQSEICIDRSSPYFLVYVMAGVVYVIFGSPTPGGFKSDEIWAAELRRGKEAGVAVAKEKGIAAIAWLGDFNFEPAILRGVPDARPTRRQAWDISSMSPRMHILSPCGHDEGGNLMEQSVYLQKIGKSVCLNAASTFVSGGRGIDLIAVNSELAGCSRAVVHNGVHCVANGCDLSWCKEVARSDHFLTVLEISRPGGLSRDDLPATSRPRMPKRFAEVEAWQEVLQPLLPLARVLGKLLEPEPSDWHVRKMSKRVRQREADVVACSIEMFFLTAIVSWCARQDLGLNESRRRQGQVSPEEWQKRWIERAAQSENKCEALTNLFRAVKPVAPQPPQCMQVNGAPASVEASHAGWRKRLVDEKVWATPPPEAVMAQVLQQERMLLQEAREASLREDFDLSLDGMREGLKRWGNSKGLASDWVPRAALCTGMEVIDRLIWAGLCRAWRLLVRPKRWGVTRQVALYKRGSLDVFKSWRNIMINTQLGLLMERLFWARVVGDIWCGTVSNRVRPPL